MPSSYRILVTSLFEKDLKRQGKKDQKIFKEIEKLKEILEADPYTTLATKKVTIYTEILLSCEYCVEQNFLPRAHLRGIFNRHGNH